jgi:drug/metabolite transporter (DMT)-like permease
MPRSYVGLAWAFAGVVLFSWSLPMTKVAVGGFDPVLTATARAVIAGACAAVPLALGRLRTPTRDEMRPLLATAAGAVFGWPILIALALERTTSAHVAVLAAFLPLTTAILAVLRTGERVGLQFWIAAGIGTSALVGFALSRGGGEGSGLAVDLLVIAAVIAAALSYVEGASITRTMPGWQVISWAVLLALPLTLPLTALLWWLTHADHDPSAWAWLSLVGLGLISMYFGFFAWYRGLSLAGIARGGQVQQLQAPLTLVWAAVFLGESVTLAAVLATVVVIGSVLWAQRGRESADAPVE